MKVIQGYINYRKFAHTLLIKELLKALNLSNIVS